MVKLPVGFVGVLALLFVPLPSGADTKAPAKDAPTKQQTVTWLNEHKDWLDSKIETVDSTNNTVIYAFFPTWKEDCSVEVTSWYMTFLPNTTVTVSFEGKIDLSKMVAQDVKAEDFAYEAAKRPGLRFMPPKGSTTCTKKEQKEHYYQCETSLLTGIPFKPKFIDERERYQNAVRHLITLCGGNANDVF